MEIAILMAAGLGTRMQPITDKIPKPLVRVKNVPMIETLIMGLRGRGVGEIYIVVGHLKEQFYYLTDKYEDIIIIDNKEYESTNNISSIYAASDVLGKADCFICEADLYVSDSSVFNQHLLQSCYFGKLKKGYSDDWLFETTEKKITRICKGGTDCYNMVGVSYFKKKDAQILTDIIRMAYTNKSNRKLFWDEIVDRNLANLNLSICEVFENQIIEIDTINELCRIDNTYKHFLV